MIEKQSITIPERILVRPKSGGTPYFSTRHKKVFSGRTATKSLRVIPSSRFKGDAHSTLDSWIAFIANTHDSQKYHLMVPIIAMQEILFKNNKGFFAVLGNSIHGILSFSENNGRMDVSTISPSPQDLVAGRIHSIQNILIDYAKKYAREHRLEVSSGELPENIGKASIKDFQNWIKKQDSPQSRGLVPKKVPVRRGGKSFEALRWVRPASPELEQDIHENIQSFDYLMKITNISEGELGEKQTKAVRVASDLVPQKHLTLIDSINYEYGLLVIGDFEFVGENNDGEINISTEDSDPETLIHEIGHSVFDSLSKKAKNAIDDHWMAAGTFDGFPSEYSKIAPDEFFCEAYAFFLLNGDDLSDRNPGFFNFLRDEIFSDNFQKQYEEKAKNVHLDTEGVGEWGYDLPDAKEDIQEGKRNLALDGDSEEIEKLRPPRPGLVPQSGDWDRPYRWIRPKDTGKESKESSKPKDLDMSSDPHRVDGGNWADTDMLAAQLEVDQDQFRNLMFNAWVPQDSGMTANVTVAPNTMSSGFEVMNEIHIELSDEAGEIAAEMVRVFVRDDNGNLFVHHATFKVRPEYQNKGIGTAVSESSESEYKKIGVHRISLTANWDVGGYAWAVQGYDFNSEFERAEILSRFAAKFADLRLDKDKVNTSDEFSSLYEEFIKKYSDVLVHSWDFATFDPFDEGLAKHFGKRAMLGALWDGQKVLDPNDQGYQIGEKYRAMQKAKKEGIQKDVSNLKYNSDESGHGENDHHLFSEIFDPQFEKEILEMIRSHSSEEISKSNSKIKHTGNIEKISPPRPGLVPQSGDWENPYRWVRPKEEKAFSITNKERQWIDNNVESDWDMDIEGEEIDRVVWGVKTGDTLEVYDLDSVGYADGPPGLGGIHVGDPDFWKDQLEQDYGLASADARTIKIRTIEGDAYLPDEQYAIPPDVGEKGESNVLVTKRTHLEYGRDWVFEGENFEEENIEKASRRGWHDHDGFPEHPVRVKDHPAYFARQHPDFKIPESAPKFEQETIDNLSEEERNRYFEERGLEQRIPPSWANVWISPDPTSDLQVTGHDAKGRKQYLYTSKYRQGKDAKKFVRAAELHQNLPKIRRQIKKDAGVNNQNAAALYLIDKAGFRVGGERATGAEKEAYGVTTLLAKHVTISGNKTTFEFVGKKGVDIKRVVSDKNLANFMRTLTEGKDGEDHIFDSVNDNSVRSYFKKISGRPFLPKDFRNIHATRIALDEINKMAEPVNEDELKKAKMKVATIVSKFLFNSPSVSLQSYIPPSVFAKWEGNIASGNTSTG